MSVFYGGSEQFSKNSSIILLNWHSIFYSENIFLHRKKDNGDKTDKQKF